MRQHAQLGTVTGTRRPGGGSGTSTARPASQYDCLIKILLIGDSGSGKTGLLLRFAENTFQDSFITTIGIGETRAASSCSCAARRNLTQPQAATLTSICLAARADFKIRTIDLLGQRAKLQIWDTAGQERFRTITQAYYRGAMGIIVVYDVTDRQSFENVRRVWIKNVNQHVNSTVRKVLVANKIDLEAERVVSTEEGQQLAEELGIPFFETSALRGDNVEQVFFSLATEIRTRQVEDDDPHTSRIPSTTKVAVAAKSASSGGAISRCC